MAHEPTQLSIATGIASEHVDYIFMDRPWLQQTDASGTPLSWKGIAASATPLHQVLWKYKALGVAFVASDSDLPALQATIFHLQQLVQLNCIEVVVLSSTTRDLHEGATFFKEKFP